MRHPGDGILRRMLDEEWAVSEPVRRHVAVCERCRERLGRIRDTEATVRRLLSSPAEASDAQGALRRQRQLQAAGRPAGIVLARPRSRAGVRWAAGVAGLVAAIALLTATPVGSYARNLLLIFEPEHFTAVPVGPLQARSLIGLQSLGRMQQSGSSRLTAEPDLQALQAAVGFQVALPSSLPQNLPIPSFALVGQETRSLTLDQAKLAAFAAQHDLLLPPMPRTIAGSVLSVTTGPVAVISYGGAAADLAQARSVPALVLAEAPVPKVFSTGATVPEIEGYVLSLPGVSPQLAEEIRGIADPTRTMPIPVPMGQATSAPVTIGGAQGLWVQETPGSTGGVVWTSGGRIYAVAGTLGRAELLAIASAMR